MRSDLVRVSKFLSLILRHDPGRIGLHLDDAGWANVAELLRLADAVGTPISDRALREAVATNDKQRFALSTDGTRIRANQGHSVAVDLGLAPRIPPARLYHGTARRHLDSIRERGLIPGARQHVHLSADVETAHTVGARYGSPIVLTVCASEMDAGGVAFFESANGVWLTASVPPAFLDLHD